MNLYFVFVLVLLVLEWILSSISEILNLNNFSLKVPEEFAGVYDQEKYSLSQKYMHDKTILTLVKDTLMVGILIFFIFIGGFGWLVEIVRGVSEYMILQGLLFLGIIVLFSTLISIPFSIYDTFVIEERYGFNKTTTKTFILDAIKGLLLTAVIGVPIFSLILWFFDSFSLAWLWVWISLAVIQLFLAFIAPVVILPLFNKFSPLDDGELKEKVNDFARAQNYKIKGIFKIDGSRRSTKGNAYFTGFGRTKRIAFFDTLIDKHSVGELINILAHEVGHCKLGHIKKRILFSLGTSLLMFYLLSFFVNQPGLYQAFGVEGTPLYAGVVFFFFIYTPISMIIGLISKAISRRHEYQADEFAAKTAGEPEDMINALKKLSVDNLSYLTPHPMKVFMEYSHPPVLQRIKALRKFI
jgi:STE24 endopeptidase